MMGEFKAVFPRGLKYTTNHMWATPTDSYNARSHGDDKKSWRFGLTSYAVRLLQDVYFLDWIVDAGSDITRRQHLGSIESKKAESDLYSPTAGQLVSYNQQALSDPSAINVDIYNEGWLMEIAPASDIDLMDVDAYLKHLDQAWVVAQRTIKGQV
ncbi:MAG TPA: glycine cleavage system protein H [Planctomycetaceae bacterium]|nr:glycine cleavage system protein H [Planctomycetaceae bacterium]